MNATILALDISSTAIGYVVRNGAVERHGVIRLDGRSHIGARCVVARDALAVLLDQNSIDALAVEAPVARFAKAIIPQARVSGVVLEEAARRGIVACEIAPTKAKRVLVEDGAASKEQMLMSAAPHFNYDPKALAYMKIRGDWHAMLNGLAVYAEHEADALGVALAAAGKVVVG